MNDGSPLSSRSDEAIAWHFLYINTSITPRVAESASAELEGENLTFVELEFDLV